MNEKQTNLLDKIYFNPDGEPGSFSSVIPLYKQAKKQDKTITVNIVKKYLEGNTSYLLHKRTRKKFPRRKIFKILPGDSWAADVIFYTNDKGSNHNKQFALINTDYFSHRTAARVLQNKTGSEIVKQFRSIVEEFQATPKYLLIDKGTVYRCIHPKYDKEIQYVSFCLSSFEQ